MELILLSIGKINTNWIKEGVREYESRIKKYLKFTSIEIPDLKNSKTLPLEKIKEEEGKLILNNISMSDLMIVLDEKGKEFTSKEFSFWIEKQLSTGKKKIIFVIGGPYGFSETIYKRADYKIALSKLTFTHEMAKLFLTEQIYRSMTILKGEPYHHE